jgi:hypothetical protein
MGYLNWWNAFVVDNVEAVWERKNVRRVIPLYHIHSIENTPRAPRCQLSREHLWIRACLADWLEARSNTEDFLRFSQPNKRRVRHVNSPKDIPLSREEIQVQRLETHRRMRVGCHEPSVWLRGRRRRESIVRGESFLMFWSYIVLILRILAKWRVILVLEWVTRTY